LESIDKKTVNLTKTPAPNRNQIRRCGIGEIVDQTLEKGVWQRLEIN
jgi:hypothetical protein